MPPTSLKGTTLGADDREDLDGQDAETNARLDRIIADLKEANAMLRNLLAAVEARNARNAAEGGA